ncbi:MAG: hypothetical protein AAF518_19970 [Spirochaetota bacterium]
MNKDLKRYCIITIKEDLTDDEKDFFDKQLEDIELHPNDGVCWEEIIEETEEILGNKIHYK